MNPKKEAGLGWTTIFIYEYKFIGGSALTISNSDKDGEDHFLFKNL